MLFPTFALNILLYCQIQHSGCDSHLEYKLLDGQYNMHHAQRECSKQFQGELPKDYQNEANYTNGTKVWLGMKKRIYKTPHWVDSCTETTKILTDKERGHEKQCGYIDVTVKTVELTSCEKKPDRKNEFGAICVVNGCKKCSFPESMCIILEKKCYIIFCGVNKWFEARSMCQSHRGDLPILENNQQAVIRFSEIIYSHHKQCTKYWMGFSKFAWIHFDRSRTLVNESHWLGGSPSLTGDCVVVQLNETNSGWMAENCSALHHVLCAKYVTFPSTSTRKSEISENPGNNAISTFRAEEKKVTPASTICQAGEVACCDNGNSGIAWGWGLSMCGLLLCTVIYIIYLKRKKICAKKDTEGAAGTEPLVEE